MLLSSLFRLTWDLHFWFLKTQNIIDFTPDGNLWKWPFAAGCALTVAHTSFTASFQAAYQWADSLAALWGDKQNYKFGEIFYRLYDAGLTAFSTFWAFALFGMLYEAAASSVNMETSLGIAFFAANFVASFFLIYAIMKNIGEKGCATRAQSSFSPEIVHSHASLLQKLQEVEELIEAGTPESLELWLQSLQKNAAFNASMLEILTYQIMPANCAIVRLC